MKHLILSANQRKILLEAKKKVQKFLDARHIDLDPVELNDGNYALPIEVLKDFLELKNELSILPIKDIQREDVKNNIGKLGI